MSDTLAEKAFRAAYEKYEGGDTEYRDIYQRTREAVAAVDGVRTAAGHRVADRHHILASALWAVLFDMSPDDVHPYSLGGGALIAFAKALEGEQPRRDP